MNSLLAPVGYTFQMNFTIPIGPSSEIVFGDIDYDEVVTVTAYDGTTTPVSLSSWTETAYTGETGVLPPTPGSGNPWPTWTVSGTNDATGKFTSGQNDPLNDDVNVLTPGQNITELKFSVSGPTGGVNFQVLSPGSSLTAVSGAVNSSGTANLTATLSSVAGTPLVGKSVTFELMEGGTPTPVGSATTNSSGVATLPNVSLPGTTPSEVMAVFNGDATDSPTTAYGPLTGNITITNARVVNSADQPMTTVSAGQEVYIEADFTTLALPSTASYRVSFDVNGVTLDSGYVTWGAGESGAENWYLYWGYFVASPGTNQVTATVDPDQSVPETTYTDNSMSFTFTGASATVGSLSYTVSQIRSAYGVNSIPDFGSATADGSGQTIAIVDNFNDPSIITDLDGFDESMNMSSNSSPTLYQQYGPASSILTVYNQTGTNITSQIADSGMGAVPPVDPTGSWEGEETMDVEWAHAIAPGAHIDLIECTGTGSFDGLFTGAATAAQLPGVTVVSMSWIWSEGNWSSASGEQAYDSSTFVTPSGHPGITFLASSGDGGTPGGYPAFSPNVVAVSATQLTLNGSSYGSETAWSFPTPRTLNNGSSSYSQTGSWTSQSGGFSGTYSTAAAGSSSSATWTTSITSSDQGWVGGTEVSATWVASPGNATNATYKIYDGTATTGTLLGTVTVNQTKAPLGTSDGGSQFQELGDYYLSPGDTLTVVLSANSANGTVVADAIGIAPAWATGGGQSQYESEPSYQLGVQSTGYRTSPDVSFDGSDSSGVTVYQNGGLGFDYFGTSLSSPCWAGLIAIADQGRVANGGTSFNSTANQQQTLQALYALPAADFHDITTGYNGLSAGVGYDELTGLGSPIANLLVPDLASYNLPTRLAITAQPPSTVTAGAGFTLTVKVEDSIGDVITSYNGTVTISLANNPGSSTLGGNVTVNAVNGVATFSGLTLNKVGTGYTLKVTSGSLTTTTNGFNVTAAAASTLTFGGMPATASAGTAFNFTVTAYDPYGNIATGYTGTIHFTSSDAGATLPANYTFTAANGGNQSFSATLKTGGTQTITAADTVTSSITGKGVTLVSTATFLKQDTTTQGNWYQTYGNQGYNAIGYTTSNPSYPSYAVVTPSGQTSYSWSSSTTDPRALQNPANPSGSRMADAWYSTNGSSFTVDVDLTDGQSHDIELYLLDWPNVGRSESIQLSNATTGAVLSTQTISSFSGGVYLQWQISGNVLITITKLAGPNSVLSGLFFDPTPTPTPTTTATFLKQDTTTQGNWYQTYGNQGYNAIGYTTSNPSYPSYAVVTPSGQTSYSWSSSTNPCPAEPGGPLRQPHRRHLVFQYQLHGERRPHRRPGARHRAVPAGLAQRGAVRVDPAQQRHHRGGAEHADDLLVLRGSLFAMADQR